MSRHDDPGNSRGLLDFSPELISNILASFSSAMERQYQHFYLASQVSRRFDAFEPVQDVLVERYKDLSNKIKDPDTVSPARRLKF